MNIMYHPAIMLFYELDFFKEKKYVSNFEFTSKLKIFFNIFF